jgi:cob(I)alamin adenosyltransferase
MPIYTRRGDRGETDSFCGKRVAKDDLRIEALGQVDELNALLGVVIAFSEDGQTGTLKELQKDLFVIGAELAGAAKGKLSRRINPDRVSELERGIDGIEAQLSPLHHFVLPGGSKAASLLHLTRTVCRRAERSVVALSKKEKTDPQVIIYLNRLGDLLFVMAREMNRKKRIEEPLWRGH